jgi:hypothetical protein
MNMFRAADNLQPAILIFLSKNLLGYSDSPVDSGANQPLPWNEGKPTDLEITGDTDESDNIPIEEHTSQD